MLRSKNKKKYLAQYCFSVVLQYLKKNHVIVFVKQTWNTLYREYLLTYCLHQRMPCAIIWIIVWFDCRSCCTRCAPEDEFTEKYTLRCTRAFYSRYACALIPALLIIQNITDAFIYLYIYIYTYNVFVDVQVLQFIYCRVGFPARGKSICRRNTCVGCILLGSLFEKSTEMDWSAAVQHNRTDSY